MSTLPPPHLSPEEYLAIERQSEWKLSDVYDKVIFEKAAEADAERSPVGDGSPVICATASR